MSAKDITPEDYTPDTSAAQARLARMENKKGDIPGIESKARDPDELMSFESLGGADWLAGGRPAPTPMLLTIELPEEEGEPGAENQRRPARTRTVGALPRGKVALLVSPGGAGKTALLCQLALSVATGTRWLRTFEVEGGPQRVVLALGEEDQEEIKLRLWDAADALGIRKDAELRGLVAENLQVLPLYGEDAAIMGSETVKVQLKNGEGREELRRCPSGAAKRWMEQLHEDTALIILDPLSRFLSGDENDNNNATAHVAILEQFTKLPGKPTVLCAHHTNKGALNSDKAPSQGDARGASGLVDGPRWAAVLSKKKALKGMPRVVLSLEKTNYTAPFDAIPLIRAGGEWRPCMGNEMEGMVLEEKKGGATARATSGGKKNAGKVTGATMEFDHD